MRFVPFLGEDEDVDKMRDYCVYDVRPDLPAMWYKREQAQRELFAACCCLLSALKRGKANIRAIVDQIPKNVLRSLLVPRQIRTGLDSACLQRNYAGVLPCFDSSGRIDWTLQTAIPWHAFAATHVPPSALGILEGLRLGGTQCVLNGPTFLVLVPESLQMALHSSMYSQVDRLFRSANIGSSAVAGKQANGSRLQSSDRKTAGIIPAHSPPGSVVSESDESAMTETSSSQSTPRESSIGSGTRDSKGPNSHRIKEGFDDSADFLPLALDSANCMAAYGFQLCRFCFRYACT